MKVCDICDGSGKIRLPIRCDMTVLSSSKASEFVDPGELYRMFPCPECGSFMPVENLFVRREVVCFRGDLPARAIDAAKRGVAMKMADYIAREGLLTFEQRDMPSEHGAAMMIEVTGRLGVLAPGRVDTIEERIAERQFEVAEEVANAAEDGIRNWGSYFGWASIDKSEACRAVREAVRRVRREKGARGGK
jgi:predicted RNA-binding Zn-ribbon protein involved in translation (DUF1610 family)